MHQFSLGYIKNLFTRSIELSERSDVLETRIAIFMKKITEMI